MKGPSHQSQEVSHLIKQAHQNVKHYEESEAQVWAQAFAIMHNLTQGINKFGEKGREAATAEVNSYMTVNVSDLSKSKNYQNNREQEL